MLQFSGVHLVHARKQGSTCHALSETTAVEACTLQNCCGYSAQMAQKQEALAALQSKVAAAEDAGADNCDRIASLQVCHLPYDNIRLQSKGKS